MSPVAGTPNIESISKALSILEAMKQDVSGWSVQTLSKEVRLHRATVHRILTTLERRGYIEQEPVTRRYKLGVRLLELGTAYASQHDLIRIGQPILDEITARTEDTSYLCVLDGSQSIILAVAWLGRGLKVIARVGDRRPLYATAGGKVLLAGMSDSDLEDYLFCTKLVRLTDHTITTPRDLRAEVKLIRERGYATNREESIAGVAALAAPVRDATEVVHASISLSWPTHSVSIQNEPDLIRDVLASAEKLGSRLAKGPGLTPTRR